MIASHERSARAMRARLLAGQVPTPAAFRAAIDAVPARERDAWMNIVWDAGDIPEDEPLPRGCVPYLPCSVGSVLEVLRLVCVTEDDVLVDVGAGLGRTLALAHLATGARCLGLEIQPALADAARHRAARMSLVRVGVLEGDAVQLVRGLEAATVFFFYCPFGGERLQRVLHELRSIARSREIRIACVDLPLPACDWLAPIASASAELGVYRSVAPPACVAAR